jgi:hypothetical protein
LRSGRRDRLVQLAFQRLHEIGEQVRQADGVQDADEDRAAVKQQVFVRGVLLAEGDPDHRTHRSKKRFAYSAPPS